MNVPIDNKNIDLDVLNEGLGAVTIQACMEAGGWKLYLNGNEALALCAAIKQTVDEIDKEFDMPKPAQKPRVASTKLSKILRVIHTCKEVYYRNY